MSTTTAVAPRRNGNGDNYSPEAHALMERVVIKGDLAQLTPEQRSSYYMTVCNSVGLNPLTQPFAYITLNGKLTLYALRNCTDQLRTIKGVSVVEMSESDREGVYVVTCKVANADGRTDMAKGAVNIAGLKGEALANAMMKAETKAKRRATLSICGLGFLDETEIEDIPASAKRANPHVTTSADVVGVPAGGPADRMPEGDGTIKPLSKQITRPQFEAMQKELHATKTEAELIAWGKANKNKIDLFQADWKEIMRGLYAFQLEDIRTKKTEVIDQETGEITDGIPAFCDRRPKPAAKDEPPADPEKFLKWADGVLATITDPGMLEPTYNFRIEPHINLLLPPDQEEVMGVYRKHERRLA